MKRKKTFSQEELRYLKLLAQQYPTVQAASSEIINLQAILNLPKGTEHFISDLHGEYEAFLHILNSCSGVIKEKVDDLYAATISKADRDELCTLIYYPEDKLEQLHETYEDMDEWYRITLHRLIEICRWVSSKYTRSKVRKALPKDYAYIIDELLHTHYEETDKRDYYENIISPSSTWARPTGSSRRCPPSSSAWRWTTCTSWGTSSTGAPGRTSSWTPCWTTTAWTSSGATTTSCGWGAASGSRTLVATVLANSIHYNNLEVIETGYGISLRPLSVFANEVYRDCDVHRFAVKLTGPDADQYSEKDKLLSARMHKAITIILFKLEGQKLLRHPEYGMADRLLLDKIDYDNQCITIDGVTYPLEDTDFPTVDPKDPYALTPEENSVIDQLTDSFQRSEKLQKHVRFLYSKGSIYKVFNGNLLFHGCIPMTEDGQLLTFTLGGKERKGKEFFDYVDTAARQAYYLKPGSDERRLGMDLLWFLWAGRNSPIFGRDRMTTFERRLIKDESAWTEPKNAYYTHYQDPTVCDMLLKEFGLEGPHCHIINGHIPVKSKKGESPIKGGGKLLVIDGGFCRAYQPTTGIAGYTLIYNSWVMRIVSHQPFCGRKEAIEENKDIANSSQVFERMESRLKIAQTDIGRKLQAQSDDLRNLVEAFKAGAVLEDHRE